MTRPLKPRAACHPNKAAFREDLCRGCWQDEQFAQGYARALARAVKVTAVKVHWTAEASLRCPKCGHQGPWWDGEHCGMCGLTQYVRPADLTALAGKVLAV